MLSTVEEIIELLEEGFSLPVVNGSMVGRASNLTWFWILGAYEVVRTMVQAKACFSLKVQNNLITLKKELAVVRMPAAKMEKQGKRVPVVSTRSPDGWDIENKDLWVNDPEDEIVSARYLFDRFHEVLTNIDRVDILEEHGSTLATPI